MVNFQLVGRVGGDIQSQILGGAHFSVETTRR